MVLGFQRQGIVLQLFVWWMLFWQARCTNPLLLVAANELRWSTILQQYQQYDFVMHVDEAKLPFLNTLGDEAPPSNPFTIFKYTPHEHDFLRPSVHKCVHYVLLEDDSSFIQHYTPVQNNVEEADIVIFLTRTLDLDRNFTKMYNTGVDNANMAFYMNNTLAYAIYFYNSPKFEADVRLVPRSESNDPRLSDFQNAFKNFRGFPMTVGYTDCKPFVYEDEEGDEGYLIGVEFKVLEIVIAMLNFTPLYDNYSNKINGRLQLLNDVNKSILNCAIGCLSNSFERNKMVAFSTSLQYEPHIVIYSSASGRYEAMSMYAVFQPLDEYVWMCCFATLILVSVSVKLLVVFDRKNVSVNSVLLPLSILLEQSITIPRRSNALRFGLITWLLVGFALSSSYKSKLTAFLITPVANEPMFLSDLVDQNYHFISPAKDSTFIMEILKVSRDKMEKHVGQELEDTKDVCEALMRTTHEITAVVEEQTVLRYLVWNECKRNLSVAEMHAMRRLEHSITINGHVWAMPNSAPYKERISEVIETLKSFGLVQKWYRSYNISRTIAISNTVKKRGQTDPLEPHDLVAAFMVLLFGCVVAAITFVFEQFIYCVNQSTTRHRRPARARPFIPRRVHFA